ncbi:hypothetical protein FHS27_006549 [Rhodopirellula rubra]|uniref:Uncharacterized protein n=2 Tax=Aporhodopirellula rubra TaxID=980271 RepID=A0A7W5E5M5_9BACT|nr:hypothetical protein [Aporhodopirellula rubra]
MITLDDIKSNPAIVDDLDWPFDFSLERADDDTDWIHLKPNHSFTIVAGDGTGGVFIAYGQGAPESLPILYATSEGQAGKVASNLSEWLALLMAIPYWRDLLKFSGNGDLEEMRKTVPFMESEYATDFDDVPAARERIMNELPVPAVADPVQILHTNVHSTDCTVVADDGCAYETLFNSFKSADNPNWR